MHDFYTSQVLDTMALVAALASDAPPDAKSVPLPGGIELYIGAMGFYPEPIAPFFCAPFCETMQ